MGSTSEEQKLLSKDVKYREDKESEEEEVDESGEELQKKPRRSFHSSGKDKEEQMDEDVNQLEPKRRRVDGERVIDFHAYFDQETGNEDQTVENESDSEAEVDVVVIEEEEEMGLTANDIDSQKARCKRLSSAKDEKERDGEVADQPVHYKIADSGGERREDGTGAPDDFDQEAGNEDQTVGNDGFEKDPKASADDSGAAEGELEDKKMNQPVESDGFESDSEAEVDVVGIEDDDEMDGRANNIDSQTPNASPKECPEDGSFLTLSSAVASSGDEEEQKEKGMNQTVEDEGFKKDPEVAEDVSEAAEGELEDETDQIGEEEDLAANEDTSQTPVDSEKECPVDGCSRKLSSTEDLVEHMLRHNKPYHCRICKKPWQKPKELRSHYRVHTRERPFECDICHKSYPESGYLKIHIRSHTGERPFDCDLCKKTFSSSSHLKRHQRSHSGERPHKCDVCDRSFAQKGNLKQHMAIHTGEKTFACEECGYETADQPNFSRHVKTHQK